MSWDWAGESLAALTGFLNDRDLLSGPVTTRRIGDGHSNLTFLVGDGRRSVVVRRPPPPPIPPGANDMLREARLLAALASTAVPVPRVLAVADAGEVIDVPLYVMSFAPGPVVTDRTPAPLDTPGQRKLIGHSLIDTLAELHRVDRHAAGLDDLGRPEGFNVRHLRRMRGLIADDNGDLPADFTAVTDWLAAHTPTESGATLIHCDYRIGNVILAPGTPGRIAAVLDWELATAGDPLFDVGYLLATVPEPGRPLNPTAELSVALLEDGYPSKNELAQRYSEQTGRDLRNLGWYTTLALWKLAVLYEYSRRRVHDGIGDPYYADPALVRRFLDDARRAAGLAEVHRYG
ncbi:phosphotransferase [Gordonia pseudamarae]|uniref:Phosphotransferase n=1 Tax=Gordonia pseudamarae TaxID=2831662 RepID=A0ABX6ILG1_9ACTN|nr:MULTISPECIES: phosphotransferase family protein [Gordonia]MBD0020779.1 phosphotransferase family protein [Gordonia sp. (in: high G+C Gram-positive bacteria)]QHN27812.1 phosphotransferase [Gordonia pseudamarae]QHN36694.1 phosphotransferase [Gordonia pseudamarae]